MRNALANLTKEQRLVNAAKGRASQSRRAAQRAASPLRRDFLDNPYWEELAKAKGVTLPTWGDPPTPTLMEVFLRECGTNTRAYFRWSGEKTLADFAKANPPVAGAGLGRDRPRMVGGMIYFLLGLAIGAWLGVAVAFCCSVAALMIRERRPRPRWEREANEIVRRL